MKPVTTGGRIQRQMNDAIDNSLAIEAAAGKKQRNRNAERQAREHGDNGNPQAEQDRRPLIIAQAKIQVGISDRSV